MLSFEVLQKALTAIKNQASYHYFFERLSSPIWIKPLEKEGYFKSPPEPIKEDDSISLPFWVESRYLVRMALLDPKTVLEVALKIPDTDNTRVYDDLAEIALNLPSNLAVQLVKKLKKGIELPHQFLLFEKISQLSIKLVKENQVESALDLMQSMLEIFPSKDEFRLEPSTRFSDWEYEEILQQTIPELINYAGLQVLEMVSTLLNKAIEFYIEPQGFEYQKNSSLWEDLSSDWRPFIADDSRNYLLNDIQEILTITVRNAAEQILNQKLATLQEVLLLLRRYPWRVFHRIILYLIYKFPDKPLISKALTNYCYFNNNFRVQVYEYAILAQTYFFQLSVESQELILNWIEHPKIDGTWIEHFSDSQKYLRRWQLDRLIPIKDSLSSQWRQTYEELAQEFNLHNLDELYERGSPWEWVGPESPKEVSDLARMNNQELINFLTTWQPELDDYSSPSYEGLSRELSKLAAEKPQKLSSIAKEFKNLNLKYSYGLLSGIKQALKEKKTDHIEQISWSSLLSLAHWIIDESQPFRILDAPPNYLNLKGCEIRRELSSLLKQGLNLRDERAISLQFRYDIWNIIKVLTQDPDPTLEYEKHSNMEALTLAINTVRGEAIYTVISYALWMLWNLNKEENTIQFGQQNFAVMPEVRQVLEKHLDFYQEPSRGVRAIYGLYFSQLTILDEAWVIQNMPKIFPRDERYLYLRQAAWDTYIRFCSPDERIYKILKEEYRYAVEQLNAVEQKYITRPFQSLIEHLMTLYWQGVIKLKQSDDELLTLFYTKASDLIRGYAIEFLGRCLENAKKPIEFESLERLKLLWETRLSEAQTSNQPDNYTEELSAFGWWFISGQFEDTWSMKQLIQVLKFIKPVFPMYLIVERLFILVETMPVETIECLSLIKNDKQYVWKPEAKQILTQVLKSNNEIAKQKAINLIHYLGAKGYWEFGELLPNSNTNVNL